MLLRDYAINQRVIFYPTSPSECLCTTWENMNHRNLFTHAVFRVSKTKWLGEKYYLHTALNNTTLLSTKSCGNWLMSVEDIASQSSVIFETRYTA